jgi:hypothetical protein
MYHLMEAVHGTDALLYPYVLKQHSVQRDNNNPPSSPTFTVLGLTHSPHTQPNLPIENDPPTATTGLIFPMIPLAMPPVVAVPVNHPGLPSATNVRRATRTHPCHECGKEFNRRALAEGCENRHRNAKPFHCRRRCGDPSWYVSHFFSYKHRSQMLISSLVPKQ